MLPTRPTSTRWLLAVLLAAVFAAAPAPQDLDLQRALGQQGLPLLDFLHLASERLGAPVVYEPAEVAHRRVTATGAPPLRPGEDRAFVEAVLGQAGVVLLKRRWGRGGLFVVRTEEGLRNSDEPLDAFHVPIDLSELPAWREQALVRLVLPLEHTEPREMLVHAARALSPPLGSARLLWSRRALLLRGRAHDVGAAVDAVREADQPPAEPPTPPWEARLSRLEQRADALEAR